MMGDRPFERMATPRGPPKGEIAGAEFMYRTERQLPELGHYRASEFGRATTFAAGPAIRPRYTAHFSSASRRCSRYLPVS